MGADVCPLMSKLVKPISLFNALISVTVNVIKFLRNIGQNSELNDQGLTNSELSILG